MIRFLAFVTMLFLWGCATAWSETKTLSKEDQEAWLRWLIPLPKTIAMDAAVTLNPGDVSIRVRPESGDVEKAAVDEIVRVWQDKAGVTPSGTKFKIVLGVCDDAGNVDGVPTPDALKLKTLPNREQAYVIAPVGADKLVLTALDEKGLYYAARTLCQLLESHITLQEVQIPLVTVLDWPDLAERGEWGGSSVRDVLWMAAHKMNLVERHVTLKVQPDGKGVAETDTDLIELARRHALKVVPILTHLDQVGGSGIYTVFPDLKGKGPGALVPSQPEMCAPCASNPKFQQILADWMAGLADHRGVNDVCAWLSECEAKCGCDECQKVGQYALEARCLVTAWRKAHEKHPDLRLRILLTQGSYPTNDKVLAECPPEVGVTYYHGGLTYDSSREPMIYPLLADFAAQGRWLGCYPQLTASWRIVCPWTGPQFIQTRMQEFVDKKLHCLCGYATPDNRLYRFNILAAAEWSWNAHGRTPEQFALAWATRCGLSDPAAAAKWAVTMGPVGWDVYGSGVPYPHFFGGAVEAVKSKKPPQWGKDVLRYFPDKQHLEANLATCAQALEIARTLGNAELIGETCSIQGFLLMIAGLADVAQQYATDPPPHDALQKAMNDLADAAHQTCQAMKTWEKTANEYRCWRGRFCDTINVIRDVPRTLAAALAPLGIEDRTPSLFGHTIGQWASDDFEQAESIIKTFDVAKYIDGPGTYTIEFVHGAGYNGLKTQRVALVDQAAQPPKEICADEHPGLAKSEEETPEYILKIDAIDPKAAYAIIAPITGVRSSDKPDNMRGCNGTVLIHKQREPGV